MIRMKYGKKIAVVLALVLIMVIFMVGCSGSGGTSSWDGSIANDFSAGSGTSEDPYQIQSAAELAYFAQKMNKDFDSNAYFVLGRDINLMNRPWTPAGLGEYNVGLDGYGGDFSAHTFRGIFDGQNYTISNLTFESNPYKDDDLYGLFGAVSGTIKNLNVTANVDITIEDGQSRLVGAIVGKSIGVSEGNPAVIDNCSLDGKISVQGGFSRVAGIAVLCDLTEITNCINNGQLEGVSVAGIASFPDQLKVRSCINNGHLVCDKGDTEGQASGGIVGSAFDSVITGCLNTGVIEGGGSFSIGGIAGDISKSTITDCGSTGRIFGDREVGGVVGDSHLSSVAGCMNLGLVSGDVNVGGVVGKQYGSELTNSYSAGELQFSNEYSGGIVGDDHKWGQSIWGCYYEETTAQRAIGFFEDEDISGDSEALSASFMQSKSFNDLLNANGNWSYSEKINDGYPAPSAIWDFM